DHGDPLQKPERQAARRPDRPDAQRQHEVRERGPPDAAQSPQDRQSRDQAEERRESHGREVAVAAPRVYQVHDRSAEERPTGPTRSATWPHRRSVQTLTTAGTAMSVPTST